MVDTPGFMVKLSDTVSAFRLDETPTDGEQFLDVWPVTRAPNETERFDWTTHAYVTDNAKAQALRNSFVRIINLRMNELVLQVGALSTQPGIALMRERFEAEARAYRQLTNDQRAALTEAQLEAQFPLLVFNYGDGSSGHTLLSYAEAIDNQVKYIAAQQVGIYKTFTGFTKQMYLTGDPDEWRDILADFYALQGS
jgi:hypothetical protein